MISSFFCESLARIFHECEAFICKAFKGAAVVKLLQALDNEANGYLGLARRVKIFEKLNKIIFGTNCHLTDTSEIVNKKRFSLLIKKPLENFHEIFGLELEEILIMFKIHPIVMGTKIFDKSMMTYQYGNGQEYTIPIYCWYLEGGDRKILVDTGEMSPIQSPDRETSIGGKIYTFEEGLSRWDLSPADIDMVIHTHLHNDHCENDYQCENAEIYVHEKEMERIHNPHPLDYRYLEDHIEDVEGNGQIRMITGDREILPGIRVVHTPVHTDGGLTVFIDTPGGQAAITGFCVIKENFYPPVQIKAMEMEVIPPGTLVNAYEAYDIMLNVKNMADILLPLHEPEFASMDTIP